MEQHSVGPYTSILAAAQSLGVPEATLRGWIQRRVVASVRIGRRRLVDLAALAALIERSRSDAPHQK